MKTISNANTESCNGFLKRLKKLYNLLSKPDNYSEKTIFLIDRENQILVCTTLTFNIKIIYLIKFIPILASPDHIQNFFLGFLFHKLSITSFFTFRFCPMLSLVLFSHFFPTSLRTKLFSFPWTRCISIPYTFSYWQHIAYFTHTVIF